MGTLRRWNGDLFMVGGILRRWDGDRFQPDPHLGPLQAYLAGGGRTSYPFDLSTTNAVTIVFEAILDPVDGAVHIAMELTPNSSGNGFFMLTESEFGTPNVLEFNSQTVGGSNDICTCPRPVAGTLHRYAWVMDRANYPCHSVFIDGVKQAMSPQPGYTTPQAGTLFVNDRLYLMARAGNNYVATGSMTTPPTIYLRAFTDAEAEAIST